jgi:hypothetical protein
MVLWSDTQSIFQLSFALNIAFYAIDDLRRPGITRAKRQLADIGNTLAQLTVQSVPRRSGEPDADYEARQKRISAQNAVLCGRYEKCQQAMDSYENATVHRVVWFHLASAAVALGCLLYGTFHPNVHLANEYLLFLIIACVNPFIFSVGYAMWLRHRFGRSTGLAISELDQAVSTGLFLLRNPNATDADAEELLGRRARS